MKIMVTTAIDSNYTIFSIPNLLEIAHDYTRKKLKNTVRNAESD